MPHRTTTAATKVLNLVERQSVVKAKQVAQLGIHTSILGRLARRGLLERVGPGRYSLATSRRNSAQHDLVVASAALPGSAICLASALQYHGLGTQLPRHVWIAVPRGTRVPRMAAPPIRVVRVAPEIFSIGLESHRVEGRVVKVYSLARTVADYFKFRNRLGLDLALEALNEAWRSKRLELDELNRIAKALRVQRVMQPYLEAVVL